MLITETIRSNALRSLYNEREGIPGKVIIETRAGGTYTVICRDVAQAQRLRDTLRLLANKRVKEGKKPKRLNDIDYGPSKLAGDPAYEEERERGFAAFS